MSAVVGILLAAGAGKRFDPRGRRLKLLEPVTPNDATVIAAAAARHLRAATDDVVAVVRPAATGAQARLHSLLEAATCHLAVSERADDGIGSSLAVGALAAQRLNPEAIGCIVALADMPAIQPSTIAAIADALRAGQATVAPTNDGRRGHPVGFARSLFGELAALTGDVGAREVLDRHPPLLIEVDDPGIHYDIDTPEDLRRIPVGR